VAQELLDAVTQWRLDAVQPQDRVKR